MKIQELADLLYAIYPDMVGIVVNVTFSPRSRTYRLCFGGIACDEMIEATAESAVVAKGEAWLRANALAKIQELRQEADRLERALAR